MEPFLARLPMEDDLVEAITKSFIDRNIRKGAFNVIGALSKCVLGYYDVSRKYVSKEFEGRLEIVSCTGNISEKDGKTFAHAHIILSGEDYTCIAGHLMPGSKIFAAELFGMPIPGAVPVRTFDEPTGLPLWSPF